MNHIAAWLLAAFATGATLLQQCGHLPPAPALLLGAAALAAAVTGWIRIRAARRPATSTQRSRIVASMALLAFAGLTGFLYAAWRAQMRLADALPTAWEARDVTITGIVDDLPQSSAEGVRFAFAVERVDTPGAVVPRRIALAWMAPAHRAATGDAPTVQNVPDVHAGERWQLTVRLKRPHGTVNPGGFDVEAWLLERNLRATGYVRPSAPSVRLDAFAGRPGDYIQRVREGLRARIAHALPGAPYAGVITALTIGDQHAIPEAQWAVFNRTGVTHLVSISGLHVTVFASLAGAVAWLLLRRSTRLTTRIPARKVSVLIGACFALAYVLVAGAEIPAMRTLLMLAVAAAGVWLARPGTAALVWLWSLVGVLLWDPWASVAPGFWLSFGAVGLLLYASCGRPIRGPPSTRSRRWAHALREGARAQWVVTVGLVPATLALFQQVSLVSAVANALAIPVITIGVVPLLLCAIVVPIDAAWRVAHAVLAALMRYLEWLAALPSATWASHIPGAASVVVAIAGVLWLLAPRGFPGRWQGGAWMLPLTLLPPPSLPEGAARVIVLDVGQGLALVVQTARHTLVYDTGPRFGDSADAGSRIVAPVLRALGVHRVDALVVSHADSDHSGGALSILQALPVTQLISSLPPGHVIATTALRTSTTTRCLAGMRWEWEGVTFALLHPDARHYADTARKSNDLSCVLLIGNSGGRVLLTGDIEARAEAQLIQRDPASLQAHVLVVPHHGSRTSSTAAFIASVAPDVAVFAAGYRNRFGHPRDDVVARYAEAGVARVRTDLQGAITLTLEGGHPVAVTAQRETHRRYWYDAPGE